MARIVAAIAVGLALRCVALATPEAASASRSVHNCAPASLNGSAVLAGSVTVSPQPGSRDASPQTQISFLGVPSGELSRVRAVGSRSGAHSGRLMAYSQGDGDSFLPSRPFEEGEWVTVHAQLRAGAGVRRLSYGFTIAYPDSISSTPEAIHPGRANQVQGFHSRPDLHPPAVTVTVQSPNAAAGEEFVAPYAGPGQAGPMILDATGSLVWFEPLRTHTSATNLQVQRYQGKPVLTWWQGDISIHGFGQGLDLIADQSYSEVAHVSAGNGYQADLHEFQLTPQGTALITAYAPILCDLSSRGGLHAGAVTDGLLQEIDVKTGLVMLQWTSLDHVALSESYEGARAASTTSPFDYFHINSIDLTGNGSLLVSARNTWAVYDIDGRSGQVAWRLGGRHSNFAAGPGTGTAWQHDPRELANGSISMFDNGASPTVHSQSRGVVVSLNPQARSATLLSQITHPPPLLAESQGNMQSLGNGDWFVGWGQVPSFSEFSADGQLLFDAHFPPTDQCYRSFRFVWSATPAHPPVLAVQPNASGLGSVYASWNGATDVASWRVLAGPTPTSLSTVAQAARTGFETAINLPPGTAGRYVTVQALAAGGAVIGTAHTVKG